MAFESTAAAPAAKAPGSAPNLHPAPALPPHPAVLTAPVGFSLSQLLRDTPPSLMAPTVFDPQQPALQVVVYPPVPPGGREPTWYQPIELMVRQLSLEDAAKVTGTSQPTTTLLIFGLPRSATAASPLLEQLLTVLGLDEDLTLFYALCDRDPELSWVPGCDGGRTLRSATVFEELVKCLLQARAAKTRQAELVDGLCRHLGSLTNLGRRAFPTAAAMASAPADFYRDQLKAGALATPLRRLAERCTSGSFYPESLRHPYPGFAELPAGDERVGLLLEQELQWQDRLAGLVYALPSYGERASDRLLSLLGCHDLVARDVATLRRWQQQFGSKRRPAAELSQVSRAMGRRLHRYGVYGGLAQRLLLPPSR